MTRFAAFRYGPLDVALMVAATVCARADTVVLPTFDVVATAPAGGTIDLSKFPGAAHAVELERHPDLVRHHVDGGHGAPDAGRHARQRLGQRFPA